LKYCIEFKYNLIAKQQELETPYKQTDPLEVKEEPFRSIKKPASKRKQCPTCGILVKNLSDHLRCHSEPRIRRYHCDHCSYSCYFKTKISRHLQKHLPKSLRQQFPCNVCSFIATRKDSLKQHQQTVHEERSKNFLCDCGKSFHNHNYLKIHVKTVHLKIRNHLCNVCGKGFYNYKDMFSHAQRHEDKKLSCPTCRRLFSCELDLRRHEKRHQEPAFCCNFGDCDRKFFTNSNLKNHMSTKHGDGLKKHHLCHLCSSTFSQHNNLKRHMDSVHKSLRISCLVKGCSYSVARKDKFKNHLTSQHKFLDEQAREAILKNIKLE